MTSLSSKQRCNGMTLLELVIVSAIIVILLTSTAPLLTSFAENNNVTIGAQLFTDQIKLASQIANSRNVVVEVRIIKRGDDSDLIPIYRAIQLWTTNSSGVMREVNKTTQFPQGIAISEVQAFSPLFFIPEICSVTSPSNLEDSASYTAFRIHPYGCVAPAPQAGSESKLYVTLLNHRFVNSQSLPANYITVQINPYTGNTITYRP